MSEYETWAARRAEVPFPFNVSHEAIGTPDATPPSSLISATHLALNLVGVRAKNSGRAAAAAATNLYCGCHAKTIDGSTAECGGALRTLYTFHSGMTSQLNTAELPPHICGENIPLYMLYRFTGLLSLEEGINFIRTTVSDS